MRSLLPVIASVVALSGCQMALGGLNARASDEWRRTYPLAVNGELQVVNSNGKLEVEGVEGDMVEVRAERIARAATEAAARELLPRIEITEDVRPDRDAIETRRPSGILIGGVEARTTNGRITIDVGSIGADPIDLRTVNGALQLTLPRPGRANLTA